MVRNISKSPVVRLVGTRYALVILIALVAMNGGILHTVAQQVGRSNDYIVKDDTVGTDAIDTIEETDPVDSTLSIPIDEKATITTYIVKAGDTLGSIALEHHISTNTIRWANNLSAKSTIKIGQELTILPVTGIQYTVKKGDTLGGIANKFHADTEEILNSNELMDADSIKAGMKLIIPDAEPLATAPAKTPSKTTSSKNTDSSSGAKNSGTSSSLKSAGDMADPIASAVLTQGRHGTNAVDFGAPVGTAVYAAMDGVVVLAKGSGAYNGGYGNYIVVEHSGGVQTLYAHLSKVSVVVGETVSKGEEIAKSGNTGRSTGPHLHFEVRGATNPFTANKVGTRY